MLPAILRYLLSSRRSGIVFALGIGAFYGLLPALVARRVDDNPYFGMLALMGGIAAAVIAVSFVLPSFIPRSAGRLPRLKIDPNYLHLAVWSSFFVFVLYTFATAQAIPIISVFQGASADELSQQRGDLFKTRTGAEIALLYLSTIFVSALLPLSLVKMYIDKARLRHLCAFFFLLFTVSSLHKGMFLNVALPLVYYLIRYRKGANRVVYLIAAASVALMFLVTVLASGGRSRFDVDALPHVTVGEYFSAQYPPVSALDLLIWRVAAVPIFSASDSLYVFEKELRGEPQLGATSSLLAAILGRPRVPFERMVFAHEWGWNDIANTNAVFFIEGFVNFGWAGVVVFAFIVGRCLRWMHASGDPAVQSLWLVFCLGLFSGGLQGMLLSNGYLVVALVALRVRFEHSARAPRPNRVVLEPSPV